MISRRVFFGLLVFLCSLRAYSNPETRVKILEFREDLEPSKEFRQRLVSLGDLASRFYRKETLAVPTDVIEAPTAVRYGNPSFGYFESRSFEYSPKTKTVTFGFIPPFFRSEINISLISGGGTSPKIHHVKTLKYKNPVQDLERLIPIQQEGKFSTNFFLVNTGLADPGSEFVAYLPTIINKWGEIVWMHVPANGERLFPGYWVFKAIGQGQFAMMAPRRYSYFEIADQRGKVIYQVDPKKAAKPFVFHHDFIARAGEGKIKTLGNIGDEIRDCVKLIKSLQSTATPTSKLSAKDPCKKTPLQVYGSSVDEVDLKAGTAHTLWNPFSMLPYKWNEDLSVEGTLHLNQHTTMDSLLGWLTNPKEWFDWTHTFHSDWMHANSIEAIPGKGFLISAKNLGKVFLISEDFKSVVWSVGPNKADHFRFASDLDAFKLQHHATLTKAGNLLVFDNQADQSNLGGSDKAKSRILEMSLEKGIAKIIWQFVPEPLLSAPIRGSAFELENLNILGFFPEIQDSRETIVEIDKSSKRPVAKITLSHGRDWLGYRATPALSLNEDLFEKP